MSARVMAGDVAEIGQLKFSSVVRHAARPRPDRRCRSHSATMSRSRYRAVSPATSAIGEIAARSDVTAAAALDVGADREPSAGACIGVLLAAIQEPVVI